MREAVIKNFLVNLSGKPGGFHPHDLAQEHINRILKAIFNNKSHAFNSDFLKEAVSLNIVQLKDLQKGWAMQMGLAEVQPGCSKGDIQADIDFLGQAFLADSHHTYDPERTQSFLSVDAFAAGREKLMCGALQTFVDQHMID
jgi:hypothetical protein